MLELIKLKYDINELLESLKLRNTFLKLNNVSKEEIEENEKVITLVADKINKNNVNALEYKRITKHNNNLSFFEE